MDQLTINNLKGTIIKNQISIFLVVLFFLLLIHNFTALTNDIGRHLRLGQIIVETHHVPSTNLFSYTATDYPFINHHWLSEVVLYLVYSLGGLSLLIVFKALILTLAFYLALAASKWDIIPWKLVILGLLAIGVLLERTDVRPEMFSVLFLAIYLYVLLRKADAKWLWLLVPAQLLWVNMHIYFILGPLILAGYLLSKIIASGWKAITRTEKWVFLSVIVINLLNPHTWKGAMYPFLVFKNYGLTIAENKSPFFLISNFNYPVFTTVIFILAVCLFFIMAFMRRREWMKYFFELGLGVVFIIAGLYMTRNMLMWGIVILPLSSRLIADEATPKQKTINTRVVWPSVVLVVLIILTVTNVTYKMAGIKRDFGLAVKDPNQRAIDFVKDNNLHGPLFNNFRIGSYLIWKLPEEKVFIDTRPEAYPADFITSRYIAMQEDPATWKKYADEYHINYVFYDYSDITSWSKPFLERLVGDPQWSIVYKQNPIAIFVRNIPENKAVIDKASQNVVP